MGKSWTFTLTEIVPYVRTTRNSTWTKRYQKYSAWKGMARCVANAVGVPSELLDPARYSVSCVVVWRKKPRADIDNAGVKNILDALWTQDRRVMEVHAKAIENAGIDEIKVTVEEL